MRTTAASTFTARASSKSPPVTNVFAAFALSSALAACGGGDDTAAALFGPRGSPAASASAMTPPTAARTSAGLYASAAQYRQEAMLNSAYTILIDADAAGGEAQAVADAMAAHAWERADTAEQQAYFVTSVDRATGVRVADLLTARGLPNVFLVLDALRARTTTDAPPPAR